MCCLPRGHEVATRVDFAFMRLENRDSGRPIMQTRRLACMVRVPTCSSGSQQGRHLAFGRLTLILCSCSTPLMSCDEGAAGLRTSRGLDGPPNPCRVAVVISHISCVPRAGNGAQSARVTQGRAAGRRCAATSGGSGGSGRILSNEC